MIEFSGNKITGFQGDAADVTAAKNHYRFVANKYGIDPFYIHSWHAGIHPSCSFNEPASRSFERWSGAAFGNPRLLHFHSCGKYPPGEISLNIVDPTISVDGEIIWDNIGLLDGGEITRISLTFEGLEPSVLYQTSTSLRKLIRFWCSLYLSHRKMMPLALAS